ncbi:MAG: DUF4136 domain-containing protein [Proteobacteria bacterium]|nr:DUF4136 domain-containing protein [Pseudomonadota bacterium]
MSVADTKRSRRLLIGLIALLSGCASLTTHTDFDRSNDFSGYRTFGWMNVDPVQEVRGETARVSPLNRQRVVAAIEQELVAKGFRRMLPGESSDFVVDYTIGARDRIEVDSYPAGYRGPWRWGWPDLWREVDVRTFTEGRLAIDIFDGRSRQPVWHGYAKRQITEADIERAEKEIPRAVAAILESFPSR